MATARASGLWVHESWAAHALVDALAEGDPSALTRVRYAAPIFDDDAVEDEMFALYLGAVAYRQLGDGPRAGAVLDELERRLGTVASDLKARSVVQRAGLALERGDAAAAIAFHHAALDAARAATRPGLELELRSDLAFALVEIDDPSADSALSETLHAAQAEDHQEIGCWAGLTLAQRQLAAEPANRDRALDVLAGMRRWVVETELHHALVPEYVCAVEEAMADRGPDEFLGFVRQATSDACGRGALGDMRWILELALACEASEQHDEARSHARTILARCTTTQAPDEEDAAVLAALRRAATFLVARLDHDAPAMARLAAEARNAGDHAAAGRIQAAASTASGGSRERDASETSATDDGVFELPEEAAALYKTAQRAVAEDDPDRALEFFEGALEQMWPSDTEPDSRFAEGYCQIVVTIAGILLRTGRRLAVVVGAIDTALACVPTARQRLTLLELRAWAESRQGRPRQAIATYELLFGMIPESSEERRCMVLTNIAHEHEQAGRIQDALDVLERAEALACTPTAQAFVLQQHSYLLHALNDDAQAVVACERALELLEDSPDNQHLRAMLLVDHAHALSHVDPQRSIEPYERAIEMIHAEQDLFHEIPAREGLLLTRLELRDISPDEATAEFDWLLARRVENADAHGELATRCNYASHLVDAQRRDEALVEYTAAIALARRLGATAPLIRALVARARITPGHAAAMTDLTEACAMIEEEHASLEEVDHRTEMIARRAEAFGLLAARAVGADGWTPDLVLEPTERVRALGLTDLVRAQDVREAASAELRDEEERVAEELELAREAGADAEVAALQRALLGVQRRMRHGYAPRLDMGSVPAPTWEALRSGPLAGNVALLHYTILDENTVLALCLAGQKAEAFVGDVENGDLDQLVTTFCATLSATGYPLLGHQLYTILIAKFATLISGRDLIVVPDGPLHRLPFGALLSQEPACADLVIDRLSAAADKTNGALGGDEIADVIAGLPARATDVHTMCWLLRDHGVRVVPSVTGLIHSHLGGQRARAGHELVGFADSDGAADAQSHATAARGEHQHGRGRLPFAREELYAIADVLKGARASNSIELRLGSEATLGEFARVTQAPMRYLHFACHATLDAEQPWDSRIVLAGDADMTAAWLIRRRLDVEHVTLSCCNTALGRVVFGDGVLGLPRAFLAAGARSLCVTLWPVVDEAGPPIMEQFYEGLISGAHPAVALRRAQLQLIQAGAHPGTWAAYVPVG